MHVLLCPGWLDWVVRYFSESMYSIISSLDWGLRAHTHLEQSLLLMFSGLVGYDPLLQQIKRALYNPKAYATCIECGF
jgi:hypothetical protein